MRLSVTSSSLAHVGTDSNDAELHVACAVSLLEETVHFARYALAIYTWYLYVFEKPCCGACDLCLYGTFGCSRRYHKR
jgi:hypothetical protein